MNKNSDIIYLESNAFTKTFQPDTDFGREISRMLDNFTGYYSLDDESSQNSYGLDVFIDLNEEGETTEISGLFYYSSTPEEFVQLCSNLILKNEKYLNIIAIRPNTIPSEDPIKCIEIYGNTAEEIHEIFKKIADSVKT